MRIQPNSNPERIIISQLRILLYRWKWKSPKSLRWFTSIEFSCWTLMVKVRRDDIPVIFGIHNSKTNTLITLSKGSLDEITAEELFNRYNRQLIYSPYI